MFANLPYVCKPVVHLVRVFILVFIFLALSGLPLLEIIDVVFTHDGIAQYDDKKHTEVQQVRKFLHIIMLTFKLTWR